MTAAAWALLVLFVIMLGLLLSIVFYRDDAADDEDEQADDSGKTDPFADELDLPEDVREMLNEQDENSMIQQKQDTAFPADLSAEDLNISALLKELQDDNEFDQEEIDEMFRPKEPEFDLSDEIYTDQYQDPGPVETRKPDPLIKGDAEIVRKGIAMAWQESEVIMSCHSFGSALLYEWEGLAKEEKVILFDVRERGIAYPMMETARSVSAANMKPSCRFAVLIHTGETESKEDTQRALGWLRSENRTPAYMISDAGVVTCSAKALEKYALLSVGSCPILYLLADCSEDTALKIWSGALEKYKISSLSETAREAFSLIRNDFPLTIRRGLCGSSHPDRAFRKAADMIPQIRSWGLPSVSTAEWQNGCSMILKAPDDVQMEGILSLLQSEFVSHGCTLRILDKQKAGTPVSIQSDAFRTVSQAVCECTDYEKALPVLTDQDFTARSIRCIGLPHTQFTRRQLYDILKTLITK